MLHQSPCISSLSWVQIIIINGVYKLFVIIISFKLSKLWWFELIKILLQRVWYCYGNPFPCLRSSNRKKKNKRYLSLQKKLLEKLWLTKASQHGDEEIEEVVPMLENKILPHHQPFQVLIPGKKITVVKNGSHRRSWPPHQWTHHSHHRPNQNRHQQLHACKITYTVQIFVYLSKYIYTSQNTYTINYWATFKKTFFKINWQ